MGLRQGLAISRLSEVGGWVGGKKLGTNMMNTKLRVEHLRGDNWRLNKHWELRAARPTER